MELAIINGLPFLLALLLAALPLTRQLTRWLLPGVMAVLFIALLGYLPTVTEQGAVTATVPWVPALGLSLSFYLDGLALLFGLVVTGVGVAVFSYAGYYFDTEDETRRFYVLLLTFSGAMLGVVLTGNLITMFIAWELTSVTSFLLIGFKGDKYASARRGAMQALMVTGAGGLALIVGLVLMGVAASEPGTFSGFDLAALLTGDSLTAHPWYTAIALLLIFAAFTKSAQWPFHFWLPAAKDAPAPASAYLHSATMVKLGVFLLARFYGPLSGTDLWVNLLVGVGLISLLLSSFLAIRARDLKTILAYTTIGQLGAMIALIGLPEAAGLKALMVGIIAHALYKAPMFLIAGVVDHATGTRDVDELGGLRQQMPLLAGITALAGLSMAGMFPWLGFVSKETLLESFTAEPLLLLVIAISAALTVAVALIIFWDVFIRRPTHEIHFHDPGTGLLIGPGLLAGLGSVFGLLIAQTIKPVITPAVPKAFSLYLLPPDPLSNTAFLVSSAAIITGIVLFLLRRWLVPMPWPGVPTGERQYDGVVGLVEWSAAQLLKTQNGQVRYYLVVILSSFALLMFGGGVIGSAPINIDLSLIQLELADALDVLLLVLALGATFASILFREHLSAALALGVAGYAIGGLFLLAQAPDVALVQFLVETLATVLIILMIGRLATRQRRVAMLRVFDQTRRGLWRDALIATGIGIIVGGFALAVVTDGENRDTIALWHIENAYPQTGVTDVVAAILADFRGTDTLIEITVFGMAALGVLTLLALGRDVNPAGDPASERPSPISTPFTRRAATVILPFSLLISLSHVLYGGSGPGDGFTAGVISGLGVALWYVVFGYHGTRQRLAWLQPVRLLTAGLALALANAIVPMFFGREFFAITKLTGFTAPAGLHFASTLIFEFAIFLAVFGGVSLIMESTSNPGGTETQEISAVTMESEIEKENV